MNNFFVNVPNLSIPKSLYINIEKCSSNNYSVCFVSVFEILVNLITKYLCCLDWVHLAQIVQALGPVQGPVNGQNQGFNFELKAEYQLITAESLSKI